MKIKLGDQVKDKITGFIGTVVSRTEFLNGCIQYEVVPKCKKGENKIPEGINVDEQSLEVVIKKKVRIKKRSTGGSNQKSKNQRGY
jgi:hypothetical protein